MVKVLNMTLVNEAKISRPSGRNFFTLIELLVMGDSTEWH